MVVRSMNAPKDLGAYLSSREPQLLDLPSEFPMPPDPVAWARDVCSAHPAKLRVEAMPRTVGVKVDDPSKALSLARDAAPELIRNVLRGISRGASAHAAMELWHADSFGELIADPAAEPFRAFMTAAFGERLHELNPLGHYLKLTMWFSADEHVYDAHCDVADGMLFQLKGEKVVEVWPVPNERGKKVLFDHAYRFSPMTTRGQRFTVSAGQALFIPAGAMHEVIVSADQISVSMSLHAGSPFPVMELWHDMNQMSGHGEPFGLPEEMRHRDKFRVYYFDPTMFRDDNRPTRMPGALRDALLDILICPREISREHLGGLLDHWWRLASSKPCYPGPYLPSEEFIRSRGGEP